MKNTHKRPVGLNPLQDLFDLYNEGKLLKSEFIKKVIPLIARYRREQIFCLMLELIVNDPTRYQISISHHDELLAKAEAIFDASQGMERMFRLDQSEEV
jgi:hypothetical protein